MKLISIIFTAALLSLAESCFAQGFINLNFEQASFVTGPGGLGILASNAIPGWTAYISGVPQTVILPNTIALDSAAVSIHSSSSALQPLQGIYSVFLQGQYNPTSAPGATNSASIGQTGEIPLAAQSMTFYGYNLVNMQVTFNGQLLSLVNISNTLNYAIWGADISAYAGQTGQLLFTTPVNSSALLDNIQFSSLPIPEPSEFALAALGALFLGFPRRRQ